MMAAVGGTERGRRGRSPLSSSTRSSSMPITATRNGSDTSEKSSRPRSTTPSREEQGYRTVRFEQRDVAGVIVGRRGCCVITHISTWLARDSVVFPCFPLLFFD